MEIAPEPEAMVTLASRSPSRPLGLYVVAFVTDFACIPAVAFILGFSAMGYGEDAFEHARSCDFLATYTLGSAGLYGLIMWCLDARLWKGYYAIRIRNVLGLLALGTFSAGVIFSAPDYPYGPLCLFMIGFPAWLSLLYQLPYVNKRATPRQFLGILLVPCTLVAATTFSAWVIWILVDEKNEWNDDTRIRLAEKVNCKPTDDDTTDPSYDSCLDAFMLWVAPLAVSLCTLLYGMFGFFLDEEESHRAPKAFGTMLMFLLFGLWCIASMAGAGSAITNAFFAFIMAGLVALGLLLVSAFGVSGLTAEAERSEFMMQMIAKYGAYADWFKGLFVVCCGPLVFVYLGLAFLNQMCRRAGLAKKLEAEDEKKLLITLEANKRLKVAATWEWASVLPKALVWGMVFMIMNVIVAKFIIVFLSWLIQFCSDVQADASSPVAGLLAVTGVIFMVGLVLFALPCVPGVPIYLTGGIIFVSVAAGVSDDDGGVDMGVSAAISYTCLIGLTLKITACACQQCLIGVPLKGWVSIRQAVAINSTTIRGMKIILQRPGLDFAKVAILVGGPDWPTSVLCGILGLPLWPVLIGTIPVIALIVPTTLSGSFLYLGSLEGDTFAWCETMATIFASLTAGVQTASMLSAAYYLERVAEDKQEELERMPFDEEVRVADALAAARIQRLRELRRWEHLDPFDKVVLVCGVVCMSVSCYVVQLLSSSCFAEFELTDTISNKLDGDVSNFVTPLGRFALELSAIAMASYFIFDFAMMRKLKKDIAKTPLPAPPPPPMG